MWRVKFKVFGGWYYVKYTLTDSVAMVGEELLGRVLQIGKE